MIWNLGMYLLCVYFLSCQMNYAHLEKCLCETREEAYTNLCKGEQRAFLRSTVKLLALFERLRSCVHSPLGMSDSVDSLQAFSQSLAK